MAFRARLVAPPPKPQQLWPWHQSLHGSVTSSQLLRGERRLEAETYLSTGFSVRGAIESREGWQSLSELASIAQPARLKGILLSPHYGQPFLAATQVFDVRPVPRKWLALEQTTGAADCYVEDGTILVTRSGSVGRATLAYAPLRGVIISDDLLRVRAIEDRDRGWIYAYLRAHQVRAMATGAQYGHMIKHLETSHLGALPVPLVHDDTAANFARRVDEIIRLRNQCHSLTIEAEALFEKAVGGPLAIEDSGERGFSIGSSAILSGRRRLDASVHNPAVFAIRKHLSRHGAGFISVARAGYQVWLPTRFRRIPAENGVWLVDSADLTEVSPELTKRIADGDFGDPYRGRVKAGWILMARSGQTYGIIGSAILAGKDLEGHVISDHVMRIMPEASAKVKPGYLVTALTHPTLGRPVVKSLAYGSSIPEIEVADLASLEVVRLKPSAESAIAEAAEASSVARAAADALERDIARDAERIIDKFLVGR